MLFALVTCVACGDDEPVQQTEDPAEAECPCRLDAEIDNLALCVSPTTAFAPTHVYSTFWNPLAQRAECEPWRDPQPIPASPWSAVRVSSACQGSGQLCVTVKAGAANNFSVDDCVLTTRCVPFDYMTPADVVELAPLGAWVAESSACAERHEQLGAYLEFSFDSEQLGCGMGDRVTRLAVCPARCEGDRTRPGCEMCGVPRIVTSF